MPKPAFGMLLLALLAPASPIAAQQDAVPVATDTTPAAHHPAQVMWYHVAGAVGGLGLLSLADKEIKTWTVEHRGTTAQDVANTWQRWGEGTIPIAITLGTLGTGLALGKPGVTRTGGRLATSLVLVTLLGRGIKKAVGRARPSEGADQYTFEPFGTFNAFPSGHTLAGFAVSTTLADAIDNRWADIGLYTLAAGTGVSRVIGNHHWTSDVVAGGLLGMTVAKVVDGRWRIFGLNPPEFLADPRGGELRWTVDVPALRGAVRR